MHYDSDINANTIMPLLLAGEDITVPLIDLSDAIYQIPNDATSALYQPITKLTNADLTTGLVGGTGTFDAIMGGFSAHLKAEYASNRISGAEYTKAFIALAESAMSNAVQYLLGRDAAFWQAAQSQAQAITARVQLATAKLQYASMHLEAKMARANYALTKLKLATEDAQFGALKYQRDNILPAQWNLLKEQGEVQRAQTSITRLDGVAVDGVLGKQRELYSQQITSYQRDAEVKAAKIFTDAWTILRTTNEVLDPPLEFANAKIDDILRDIKTNNNIGV